MATRPGLEKQQLLISQRATARKRTTYNEASVTSKHKFHQKIWYYCERRQFVSLETTSDCRDHCRVCPAVMATHAVPFRWLRRLLWLSLQITLKRSYSVLQMVLQNTFLTAQRSQSFLQKAAQSVMYKTPQSSYAVLQIAPQSARYICSRFVSRRAWTSMLAGTSSARTFSPANDNICVLIILILIVFM